MNTNPYEPPLSPGTRRSSAVKAYGVLNLCLVLLLVAFIAVPLIAMWFETWSAPREDNGGDPVTYQHYFYVEPYSLGFLAVYFYIPNAILRYLRRNPGEERH